jgi:hypothetical protein
MRIDIINIGDNPYKSYRIILASVAYNIIVRFNNRMGRWHLDLVNATTQEVLFQGLRIMPSADLTFFTAPEFRERVGALGIFSNYDFTNGDPVDLDAIGDTTKRVSLVFTDVEARDLLDYEVF